MTPALFVLIQYPPECDRQTDGHLCSGYTSACYRAGKNDSFFLHKCNNDDIYVGSETIACPEATFDCPSNRGVHRRVCLPAAMVCDGKRNCLQGEDEQSCGPRTCGVGQYSCQNGVCIPQRWICDRDNDCGDNSDEPSNCSALRYVT